MRSVESMRPGSSQLDVEVGNYLLCDGELEALLLSILSSYQFLDKQVCYPSMPLVQDSRQLRRNTWAGFSAPVQDRRRHRPCPEALKKLLPELRSSFFDGKNEHLKTHLVFIARIISALIVACDNIFVDRFCEMQDKTRPHFIGLLHKVPSLQPMFKEALRFGVQLGDRSAVKIKVESFLNSLNNDTLGLGEDTMTCFEDLLRCIGQRDPRESPPLALQGSMRMHRGLWRGNPGDIELDKIEIKLVLGQCYPGL